MPKVAVGLMSGTSLDGIDAALLVTDGKTVERLGPSVTVPYTPQQRAQIRSVFGGHGPVMQVQDDLTRAHAQAVHMLLSLAAMDPQRVDVIGFHGQTILHMPDQRRTWQIGDGQLLADLTGIAVVNDFRSADVAVGGQGAPLVPVYHRALAHGLPRPLAVLNLGGVGNVTWMGGDDRLVAFDTGPGNALIDDWICTHTGNPCDQDGVIALGGRADRSAIERFCRDDFFAASPPKSLDRDHFQALAAALVQGADLADGAATLVEFTAQSVARSVAYFPVPPALWLVCGGGRHNPAIMAALSRVLKAPVRPVESVGWNGDALEAQAFAFLAVLHLSGLAQTFPETTGCPHPMTGGRLHFPCTRI